MNIMGKSELTLEQMEIYLYKINPTAPDGVANLFLIHGSQEGVRGDLAFCQCLLETNSFKYGGTALIEWKNTAGLGVTGEKNKGERFTTWSDGILAQIQHLKAYASNEPLKTIQKDNRFNLVKRNIAPTMHDLNGKWAVPGKDYGQKILDIYNAIKKITPKKTKQELEIEDLVNKLSNHIQFDKVYWSDVLLGKTKADPNFLKIIFERFVESKTRK